MAKKKVAYDEKAIQTLDALEHIRLRTGMYIGRLGDGSHPLDGIYVMLKEVVDNSVDEFIASFEAAGPAVSGVITYEDDANPLPLNEPLDYTLTCTLVNWELQNIREVSDI